MNIRDYMASEITTLRAGGPGSGRHPEFGSFVKKRRISLGDRGSMATRYESPGKASVTVNEQGWRKMKITGPDSQTTAMTYRDGKQHLREKYGINHES